MSDHTSAAQPLHMLALLAAPLIIHTPQGPQPVAPLALNAEVEAIVAACKQLPHPVGLELRVEVATAGTLGHVFATTRAPFDILHFSGHGSVDAAGTVLVLEDEHDLGAARLLAAHDLHDLLGQRPCRLAFLSACHSAGLAHALLSLGVAHVVAIAADDSVLDAAARSFAQRFYPALLAGRSVADAFARAVAAVQNDDALRAQFDSDAWQRAAAVEAPKFRLLPEGDPAHQQPLVANPPPGTVRAPAHRWQRSNLPPVAAEPFAGRRRELHALASALRDPHSRCLALRGPGGMGKTALAEAAGRWQHERARWPEGVWLAKLRNIESAALARNTIALALDLPPEAGASDAALAGALSTWQALLILDDVDALCTHDRAGLAALLNALLGMRGLRLLTTARQTLPGQVHHHSYELRRLERADALAAFYAYAPPPEEWGAGERSDLRNLLTFLDGYPFPIRLAATYLKQTRCGLAELVRALEENPRGTLRYPGDEEDRETSLAATLDLSFRALPTAAQAALPQLALFPAGLSRAAARAIMGDEGLHALEALLRYSMAEWRDDEGDARFALPEPARRYAEALQPPGLFEQHAPAALAYFHALVERADDMMIDGNIPGGRVLLTQEQPNLWRVLDWGYAHEPRGDGQSLSARATARLKNYWMLTDAYINDAVHQRLERALAAALHSGDRLGEAYVRQAIGDVQQFRKDTDAALASYTTALALFQTVGDRLGEANVRKAIGDVQLFRKDTDAALASYTTALALFQTVGDCLGEANVLAAQSRLWLDSDPRRSQALLEAALALRDATGDHYSAGADLGNYGIALLQRGRMAEARGYLQRARAVFAARGIAHLVEYMDTLIAQTEAA